MVFICLHFSLIFISIFICQSAVASSVAAMHVNVSKVRPSHETPNEVRELNDAKQWERMVYNKHCCLNAIELLTITLN